MQFLTRSFGRMLKDWRAYRGLSEEERYLSKATDLFDLENRQKELTYGKRRFI